jgi:hypothetical protein
MRWIMYATMIVLLSLPALARAAPEADLWSYWTEHDPGSEKRVDHAFWNGFLQRYVRTGERGINLVAYSRVTQQDRQGLGDYIRRLERTPVLELSRPVQLAYWINLYNALTVKLVLDHYPVQTIKDIDISPGWFSVGPWDKKLVTVEGKELSLNDIEHRILRPVWKDPRIHYGVNCASMGCPDLRRQAFTGENADRLLESGARRYINHPRGASVRNGELVVSSIYKWFTEDFGSGERDVIEHLKRFAEPELRRRLQGFTDIGGYRYDWSLNDLE